MTATHGARTTDPDTSLGAALAGDEEKWSLHRELLLGVWARAGVDGLTDEEAGDAAGLQAHYFWKRGGELREPHRGPISWEQRAGRPLIAYDGRTRKGRSGRPRKVSVITDAGLDYCRRYGLPVESAEELTAEVVRLRSVIRDAIAVAEGGGKRAAVIEVLRRVWLCQFYLEEDHVRWRTAADLAPAGQRIDSPYDP